MAMYAVSDLHGMYNLWKQVKNFIKEDDILYVLGDCADRGEDGWKIIKEVIDMPNIVYIRGNHEQMIIDNDISLWYYNGGGPTIRAAEADIVEERERVIKWLEENTIFYTTNLRNKNNDLILLSHAGYDPNNIPFENEDYLWDRYHLPHKWEYTDDCYVIHGHTPIQHMKKYCWEKNMKDTRAYWYADGHKICIDPGSVSSNETILFNLDTFEEIIFKGEINE